MVVVDKKAVEKSIRKGLNKYITLNIGGSLNPKYNKTLKVTGKIINITNGKFQYKGKVYNGRKVEMGRCVVLKINNFSPCSRIV